jgi:hypothetical protein
MHVLGRFAFAALSLLPCLACGATIADVPAPPGNAGDAAPAITTDAGGPTGDTGTTTSSGDAAVGDAGTLLLQAFGGASGQVAAQVPLLEPGVGLQQTCSPTVNAGACRLTSCTQGGIGSPGGGYGNFGPMSASVGTTSVPITYNGTGYPTVYFPPAVTLGTGGTMTFHGGNGGSVPTFDVPATIPGLAVITSPVPTEDGGSATIDTSQDLSVTWLPIAIGQINFELDGGPSGEPGGLAISIACTFGGDAGSGVIPRALLASMKTMAGSSPTYASVSSVLTATTVVDGLNIVTQSFQSSPTAIRSFNVTLE